MRLGGVLRERWEVGEGEEVGPGGCWELGEVEGRGRGFVGGWVWLRGVMGFFVSFLLDYQVEHQIGLEDGRRRGGH